MEHPLIHDRGRGPELVGTRITIYTLVPYFLKPEHSETAIADEHRVSVEQVAAMRAYFLNHYSEVMAGHEKIEARFRKGMEEQAKRFPPTPYDLRYFQDWIRKRVAEAEAGGEPFPESPKERLQEFRTLRDEWMGRQVRPLEVACAD